MRGWAEKLRSSDWIIAIPAGVLAIIGWFYQSIAGARPATQVSVSFLGIISIWFLGVAVVRGRSSVRAQRTEEALADLEGASADVASLTWDWYGSWRDAEPGDELMAERVRDSLQDFSTKLADAFSKITGTRCSACIKLVDQPAAEDDAEVYTFCRDGRSDIRRHENGDVDHRIDENTDFLHIHNRRQPFFENDLLALEEYRNSSFKIHRGDDRHYVHEGSAWFSWAEQAREALPLAKPRWELEYRSTIVVPISPPASREGDFPDYLGYLCIDSNKRNAFKEDQHTAVCASAASAVYPVLHRWHEEIHSEENDG